MGREYIVIQIALLTLRKLIYRDCVSYSKMLVYILICYDGGAVTSGEAARNTACQRAMIFRMPPTFVTLADRN